MYFNKHINKLYFLFDRRYDKNYLNDFLQKILFLLDNNNSNLLFIIKSLVNNIEKNNKKNEIDLDKYIELFKKKYEEALKYISNETDNETRHVNVLIFNYKKVYTNNVIDDFNHKCKKCNSNRISIYTFEIINPPLMFYCTQCKINMRFA